MSINRDPIPEPLTLPSGRQVHIIDTGCDMHPKSHFVWIGQIAPEFAIVYGDYGDCAHEYFADHIKYKGLDVDEIVKLAEEIISDDPSLTEEQAYEHATEGMLPLNGGAEYIDQDDWGFWIPTIDEEKTLIAAAKKLREESW